MFILPQFISNIRTPWNHPPLFRLHYSLSTTVFLHCSNVKTQDPISLPNSSDCSDTTRGVLMCSNRHSQASSV